MASEQGHNTLSGGGVKRAVPPAREAIEIPFNMVWLVTPVARERWVDVSYNADVTVKQVQNDIAYLEL